MLFQKGTSIYKRIAGCVIAAVMSFTCVTAHAPKDILGADATIFNAAVDKTYTGRAEAKDLIKNLNFTDITDAQRDAVTRAGAFNMVKGYGTTYKPQNAVTNQEAIAFVMRVIGQEQRAQNAGLALQAQMPEGTDALTLWTLGYLDIARGYGLITANDFNDALVWDQSQLDPKYSFMRNNPVSREQMAQWLLIGLRSQNNTIFPAYENQQGVYTAKDWKSVGAQYIAAVETMIQNRIMSPDATGNFKPKANVTRADMAYLLKKLDSIYYKQNGMTKKTGTVAGIKDAQKSATGSATLTRGIYVRRDDGKVDLLQYDAVSNTSPQAGDKDAVVLKGSKVGGLGTLLEGDAVEYIVRDADNVVMYVQTTSNTVESKTIVGFMDNINVTDGTVTVTDSTKKSFTYNMAEGTYGTDNNKPYIRSGGFRKDLSSFPQGSKVELTLKNNIVNDIKYIGDPVLVKEARGIVTENDPDLGFVTVIDNTGNKLTFNYNPGNMKVTKTQYYDMSDEVGYINEVFPNFKFNPKETDMSTVQAGDIIFYRTDPADPSVIVNVSAATNYTTRFGKIKEMKAGDELTEVLLEFDDKQTAWYDVANDVFVTKTGKPSNVSALQVGDSAKFLINQALIDKGYITESVIQISVEGDGKNISTIVKGQLAGINRIQSNLSIQNAQTLGKTGWENYKQVQQYSIAARDIEYYYDGKKITLDFAVNNLKRSDGDVYIALENNYSGEKIKKITFRSERDEFMPADTVVSSTGTGGFSIISNEGTIRTDAGTIVRRNGKLVDGKDIETYDHAVVSLNGENRAAVVDIFTAPGNEGIMMVRGRILSVNEGKSFKVQSMSILNGVEWNYTPIQREFVIDYNTMLVTEDGVMKGDEFKGYTDASAINRVYTVLVNGSKAVRIIDAPFAYKAVRGTVYQSQGGALGLKSATYYNNQNGKWINISNTNATLNVTVPANSIVVKNNATVAATKIAVGDQVTVLTDALPDRVTSGTEVAGYLVTVDKP